MKISQLLEAIGDETFAHLGKMKKLAFLTPELMAQHHQKILNLISKSLTSTQLDQFAAELTGSERDVEDVDFELNIVIKSFPEFVNARLGKTGLGETEVAGRFVLPVWQTLIDNENKLTHRQIEVTFIFRIFFRNAKWVVELYESEAWRIKRVDELPQAAKVAMNYIALAQKLSNTPEPK